MENDSGPATIDELHAALDELVLQAHANGLDFYDRGYALRHDESEIPDWELVISRTTKPRPSD